MIWSPIPIIKVLNSLFDMHAHDKQKRGTDGREKVVVIEGSISDGLYLHPPAEEVCTKSL